MTTAGSDVPQTHTLPQLRQEYEQKMQAYDALFLQASTANDLTKVPELKKMNKEISDILDKMQFILTNSKDTDMDIQETRRDLVAKLQRIQQDFNGLSQQTDQLQTLRRIRLQESVEGKKDLYWYILLFLGLAIMIGVVLIFFTKRASPIPTTYSAT